MNARSLSILTMSLLIGGSALARAEDVCKRLVLAAPVDYWLAVKGVAPGSKGYLCFEALFEFSAAGQLQTTHQNATRLDPHCDLIVLDEYGQYRDNFTLEATNFGCDPAPKDFPALKGIRFTFKPLVTGGRKAHIGGFADLFPEKSVTSDVKNNEYGLPEGIRTEYVHANAVIGPI